MKIRNVKEGDLDSIARVAVEAMNPIYGERTFEENKEVALNSFRMCDKRFSFVAEEEGKVVGFSFSRIMVEPYAEFSYGMSIAVLPSYQGKGVGKALINKTIEVLKEEGFHEFKFHVLPDNEKAVGLYKKMGFEVKKWLMGREF